MIIYVCIEEVGQTQDIPRVAFVDMKEAIAWCEEGRTERMKENGWYCKYWDEIELIGLEN